MKVVSAMVFTVLLCSGIAGVHALASPPQQAPQAETPQSGAGNASPQQPGAPPTPALPCAQSKDTCEVIDAAPQEPATTPAQQVRKPTQTKASPKAVTAKRKKAHRHKATKKTTVAQEGSGPKKTVVRNGGTADPTAVLTPGVSAQTAYSREATQELLSATDANLKQAASRSLNTNQEATVSQIKLFMEQANAAMKAGDLDRSHNLATKAHLLSDDLVKH